DHGAHHIAAKDVQNDVQIIVGPCRWPLELGNIPAPQLLGSGRQQLRFRVERVPQLVAAFPHLPMRIQNAVHRAPRAQIDRLIEQGRVDLAWRAVRKALVVEDGAHAAALLCTQSPGGYRAFARKWWRVHPRVLGAVVAAARDPQHATGLGNPHRRRQLLDRLHHDRSSLLVAGSVTPSSCESFFWTSIMASAWVRRACKRAFSRRTCANSSASGSRSLAFRPRVWGARAWS